MQDRRHPHGLGPGAVLAQVVHEHAFLGDQADALRGQAEDLGLGLVQPDLAGDHDDVEQLAQELRVVGQPVPPGVRDQAGADAGGAGAPDGVDHRLVGADPAEQALDQAVGLDAQ